MNLSDVEEEKVVEIVSFRSCRGLERRLLALSIRVGDLVKIIENCGRGPILIEHLKHGHRIALGRGIASKIEVRVVENSSGRTT